MADYLKAFRAGLDAYNDAERARNEIADVFEEFARAVQDASGGHLVVERRKAREVIGAYALAGIAVGLQKALDPLGPQSEECLVLVARGRDEQKTALLCEYALGERGYPVKLLYGRVNVRCHDRESLEQGLQELLEHPDTGGKLRRLMSDDRTSENGASPSP